MKNEKLYSKKTELSNNITGYASIDKPWLAKKKHKINMPNENLTAYEFLYECNKNNLDDIALIYDPIIEEEPTKITYKQLFQKIDDCAKAYIAIGIKKGDIVTVSLPSLVENIVNFYALNKIGAVANQIHPLASQDEIEFYLEEAKSTVFLGFGDVYNKIKNINQSNLKHLILVSPTDSISLKNKLKIIKNTIQKDGPSSLKKLLDNNMPDNTLCISWTDFIKKGKIIKNLDNYVNHDSNILATLTHTSGTTGKSKAVMTNSKAFNSSVNSILQETNLFQRYDRELLVLPPFPLYILNNAVHLSLSVGIELVVIPKVDYSKMSTYFKKHHPNHLKGIPSTMESILNDKGFNDYDFSNFKFLISGGGKLNCEKEINEFLKSHNCQYNIANGYGMSEAGGCVTCMFENTIENGTVGRPLINSCAKAVDLETGEEIKYTEDKTGEIWLTGPSIMQGYYKNKAATQETMTTDANGVTWIKTGDLGKITKEGNVNVIGRLKRMTFIFDSTNNTASKVSHDYMETTLCENDKVEDCIVVSVPNSQSLNALKAYVLIKDSPYDQVINELDELCKTRFRKYVSPIEYIIVDNIPKTAAGKNDYRYIEDYEEGKIEKPKMRILQKNKIQER